jgi:hypothetical protein
MALNIIAVDSCDNDLKTSLDIGNHLEMDLMGRQEDIGNSLWLLTRILVSLLREDG